MSTYLLKVGLPAMGIVGSAGIGYGIHSHISSGSKQEKTLRDLLSGVSLISDSKSKNWETIFEDLKAEDEELINTLKSINPAVTKTSKNVDVAPILSKWCNDTLDRKEGAEGQIQLISKIKKWCIVQPFTISEKLKNKGLSMLSSGWDTKYDGMKESIFDDIKSKGESFTDKQDKSKGGNALQAWCTENSKKGTHEEGASRIFKQVKTRCTSFN